MLDTTNVSAVLTIVYVSCGKQESFPLRLGLYMRRFLIKIPLRTTFWRDDIDDLPVLSVLRIQVRTNLLRLLNLNRLDLKWPEDLQ
jgi:hypothetical protein